MSLILKDYSEKLKHVYNVFCLSAIYSNKISFTYLQLKFIMMFKPSTAHKLNGNWCLVLIIAPC